MSSSDGITAVLILEVIGKPKEHILETLENLIKQMGEEKGVIITDKKINEPVNLKGNEQFFTTFAEIEVQVEEIAKLIDLIFKYMPAHVEILQPEVIGLTNTSWSNVLSELVVRLHGYDEVARIVQTEKMILEKKLKEIEKNKK